jgi:peptide/nickel transport system permease protein
MTDQALDISTAGTPKSSSPILRMVVGRLAVGLLVLVLVSFLIFFATTVLPGNAATAILGHSATPDRVHYLERQMHLNDPLLQQYWAWASGLLHGDAGNSLVTQAPVTDLIGARLSNSIALVVLAGIFGSVLGVALGVLSAARVDSKFDDAISLSALTVTALPEFAVAIVLVSLLAVNASHVFPAVSFIPDGSSPWANPDALVLPVISLVIVILPYIVRMTRGAMVDALHSDYIEMARLKGMSKRRVILMHALPNALPPIIQVIGLSLLYLAGGIVVVEYVFNYPGIGTALVTAVSDRDIPTIQFIVLMLAAFYIVVNIVTDVLVLLVTPRRRWPRHG